MIEPAAIIARPVDGGRAVQPPVGEALPAARDRGGRDDCRIGRDAGDVEAIEQCVGRRIEPARVSWLANQPRRGGRDEPGQERLHDLWIEGQLGRHLQEQDAKLATESANFIEEAGKPFVAIDELALVGDGLRDLGCEAEGGGDAFGPALPGHAAVGAMEGGVDLDGVEARGVTDEGGCAFAEMLGVLGGDAPAGGADDRLGILDRGLGNRHDAGQRGIGRAAPSV
jgi:hypothetical protein